MKNKGNLCKPEYQIQSHFKGDALRINFFLFIFQKKTFDRIDRFLSNFESASNRRSDFQGYSS